MNSQCEVITKERFNHPSGQCKHRAEPKSHYCKKHSRQVEGNELLSRIQNYLCNGGLFNPEMMEHEKVRDLIMDCRDYIEKVKPNDSNRTTSPMVNSPANSGVPAGS